MAKQNTKTTSQNSLYYVALTAQRVSLLLVASSTILLWATLVSVAHSYNFTNSLKNVEFINLDSLNHGSLHEVTTLANYAIILSLLAMICSLALLALPQISKYRKHLVFDGVLLGGFCLIVSIWHQPIFSFILSKTI